MESNQVPAPNSHKVSPQISNSFDQEDERPRGYSHDDQVEVSKPDWMNSLDGEKRLSDLSIPGTHDTMAFFGGDITQTQALSLRNQLQSGIRAFDIRCRHIADVFAIHHGLVFQNTFFGDVLNEIIRFLTQYPKETVYMNVQEEYQPANNTRTFEDTFRIGYWEEYKNYFWKPSDSVSPSNPTLKETRGKIVLLQNFSASQKYGISWDSFSIQNEWTVNTNWDLYDKWLKIKEQLRTANEGSADTKYINFLSASGGSFPYFVASGQSSPQTDAPRLLTGRTTPGWADSWPDFPRISCFIGICSIAFEGTNILTAQRVGKGRDFSNRLGIIMADFPGPDLISRVIELNL